MKPLVETPKSKFLKVLCKKCKNEQIIFSKSAVLIKCSKCGEILVEPAGGKARIKGRIIKVLS
jgi:small subunit ribosomal protein S27e